METVDKTKEDLILDKLEKLIEICKEISDIDSKVGDVFLMNVFNSMEIIKTSVQKTPIDISDKIVTISNYLGIDLEELVINILEKHNNYLEIIQEETDANTVDFIINNTKNIDDYEKFLQENSVKENLDYLKENI